MCRKTFEIFTRAPYAGAFQLLEPAVAVDPATAPLFDCAPQTAPPTPTEPASVVRRAVSGLTTAGGNATTGCC